jgi:hypothetical protein
MLLEVDVAAQGAHERRSRVVALWSALLCHRAQGFCVSAYVHLARCVQIDEQSDKVTLEIRGIADKATKLVLASIPAAPAYSVFLVSPAAQPELQGLLLHTG